ncbi:unnamed protein product [Lathyrus oleraceus]|uniref:GH18 domain-containing protein n=1 Tax=Pisum sativum TaxID=3888 RepID=A0A9D4XLJ3_PEA|nr:chitinase 2-like [Pisum sativum]KAI5422472.1 hypothetical protein KIW84_045786 [Pisum sativum]
MSEKRSETVRPIIYREYLLKHFPTTDCSKYNQVDFIIGFASEDYNPNGEGTGRFHPTWDLDTFSPEKLKKLKERYPHVRVVISIGGDIGTYSPFNPNEKKAWIATAVYSLTDIILGYDDRSSKSLIDGIDIHYGNIKSDDFSYCIGEVIKSLKNNPRLAINVVSIAAGEYTQSDYLKLYVEYRNYIDIVHYLFINWKYCMKDLVEFYKKLVAWYSHATVLPGYLNPSFPGDKAKEAVMYLVKHNLAPGFFTYPTDNDSSVGPSAPFSFEEDASKPI